MEKFKPMFLMLIPLLISLACTVNEQDQMNSRYYLDIDLFHLKGINEISVAEANYPYIRIDSVEENKKIVRFFYDKNTAYERTYLRINGSSWISKHKVHDSGEGTTFYFYELLDGKRIIKLEYNGDPFQDSCLVTLKVMEENRISFYDFDPEETKVNVRPTPDISSYPLNKSFRKGISNFEIKNGILIYRTQDFDTKTNKVIKEDKKCYWINNLSYFWWSMIGHRLGKTDCEG